MNLYQKRLSTLFLVCLGATLLVPSIAPSVRLVFFGPFLVISYYQKSLFISLCYALGCGIIVDLLSADIRFGMHALTFCLATLLLYEQRKNFFPDNISTLPIITFFFSVLATGIDLALLYAFQQSQFLSLQWIICDGLVMPSLDALFAFAVFILPSVLLGKRPRKGEDYFRGNCKTRFGGQN